MFGYAEAVAIVHDFIAYDHQQRERLNKASMMPLDCLEAWSGTVVFCMSKYAKWDVNDGNVTEKLTQSRSCRSQSTKVSDESVRLV